MPLPKAELEAAYPSLKAEALKLLGPFSQNGQGGGGPVSASALRASSSAAERPGVLVVCPPSFFEVINLSLNVIF